MSRNNKKFFSTKTILAVGAHPDDYEIGCGGTIKIFTDLGSKVYGLVLTDGERGGHGKLRVDEAKRAGKFLGMKKIFFAHKTDAKLVDDIDTVDMIEKIIKQINPDIILTHSVHDGHQDHRYCSLATIAAARNSPSLLMYETQRSIQFEPHMFFDITKTFKPKIKAIRMHTCQINKKSINLKAIESIAKYRGFQFNVKYAEGFEINHMLANSLFPKRFFR